MEIDYAALGQKIRIERQKNNLSQDKLAELCEISTSYLGHIERGTRKMSLETLVTIANVLNISLDYLLTDNLTQSSALFSLLNSQLQSASPTKAEQLTKIIKILSKNIDEL